MVPQQSAIAPPATYQPQQHMIPTPQQAFHPQQPQHHHYNPSNVPQQMYVQQPQQQMYQQQPQPMYVQQPQQQMYQQQPQPMYVQQPQQPIYQQSTQHTARYSQTPNQGRQVEISVTQQVSQQPPHQFAPSPPAASYPQQQQLQYGQNQVGVPPPVQYAQNPPPPHP
jgi:hypothetical protein